jgi:TRAP-type transport system periplasmic protein
MIMKKMSVRTQFAVSIIVAMLISLTYSPVWSKEKTVEWKFEMPLPETREESKQVKRWAERILERSGGRLKIDIYYAGSLGFKPTEVLRVMKAGAVESALIYDQYVVRDEPALGALSVQGTLFDPDDYKKVINPMIDIKKKLLSKWDIYLVGNAKEAMRWIQLYSKQPINSLSGMKGKKIRVWSKDLVESLGTFGVAAQIIPQADIYLALKTGVVDGGLYPESAAKSISLYEVTKYASRMFAFSPSFTNLGVSKSAWEALDDNLKAVVLEAGNWLLEDTLKEFSSDEAYEPFFVFLREKGIVFIDPFPDADRKLLQKAAFEVWENMAKAISPEAVENYKILRDALLM